MSIHNCGGKGHPARLCRHDHATQADDGEGDTDEESSEVGDVCGVEWEYDLNGAGDEDDDILGIGWSPQYKASGSVFHACR